MRNMAHFILYGRVWQKALVMSWLKQRKAPSTKVAEVSKGQPQLHSSARKLRPQDCSGELLLWPVLDPEPRSI